MIEPGPEQHHDRERVRHHVRERAAGEHRGARGRQRAEAIDQALREVLGQAERGHEAAERDVLDDDPGDQEVDVVVARCADRAAEHVGKQQHEHHGLDREGDQQVGGAREPHEVALGEHQRVGGEPGHAATSSALGLGLVAGEREEDVVERRAPHRDVVDAQLRLVEPAHRLHQRAAASSTGRRTERPSICGSRRPCRRAPRPPRAPVLVREVDLEALAADAVLELVGGAVGDHAAVVDDRDAVRQPVGLVEVLGGEEDGRAVGDERLDRLPQVERGCAGRARSSARRGRAPAGARRARRRGRAAAACRPNTSSPRERRRRSGRSARAAPRPRALATRRRWP